MRSIYEFFSAFADNVWELFADNVWDLPADNNWKTRDDRYGTMQNRGFYLTFKNVWGIICSKQCRLCRGDHMCDVKKYEKIYEDIKSLQPEDTLQLVLEAETEEQRCFYEMVGDFLLQRKQRQVIERKLF